jgi:hypothetical protein
MYRFCGGGIDWEGGGGMYRFCGGGIGWEGGGGTYVFWLEYVG